MQGPLVPARLAFHDGVPYSEAFGDVYHSMSGGPAQARHVFLGGNRLPERWRGRDRFVILETGFGAGLNFLVTLQAWRRDPQRCARLHFVSVEKHPFALQDLQTLHEKYEELKEEAAQLHAIWPSLVPGAHRLELESGRVVLTLFFADVKTIRDLRLAADAIYLDGFAPAKNPEMWSPAVIRAISRVSAPGATAATWSVAGPVREALEIGGFRVEKAPGFGTKREMLLASLARSGTEIPRQEHRKASVVGAGIAGAAVCERLCARGWEVTLYERHARPAEEASGNHAGTFHPIVTPDDSVFARITRAGFFQTLMMLKRISGTRWDPCGVLQLARDEKEEASQRAAIAALQPPADYVQWVTRDEASKHAGIAVAAGGLWFPQAGWIQPRTLVNSLLDACGDRLTRIFSSEVVPEAERVIFATANDALMKIPHARFRKVRGQVSHLDEASIEPPHAVLLRGGFILPPVEGICVVGASYDVDDHDAAERTDSHEGNLERLSRIAPEIRAGMPLEGRVGFRWVVQDRLPVVGRIADGRYGVLALGSRGLTWAALAAELIASELEGDPCPLEASLAAALAPERFSRRALARRAAARASRS